MNDKELEKILNFVLNNMGNKEMMRIVDLQKTAQIYYLKCEELQSENAKLRECVEFYADRKKWTSLHEGIHKYKTLYKAHRTGSKRARQVLKELNKGE